MLQGSTYLDPATALPGRLINARDLGLQPSVSTQVLARLIARRQCADGHWMAGDYIRPPQSFSAVAGTAKALRVLQLYLPKSMAEEQQVRVRRAGQWLAATIPADTEDRVYQLFGQRDEVILSCRNKLLAEQRADGGWGQIASRSSDAYATGEVLSALNQAGGLSTSHLAFQRGLRYLLNTRQADGTWFVSSRLYPPAPVSPPCCSASSPLRASVSDSARPPAQLRPKIWYTRSSVSKGRVRSSHRLAFSTRERRSSAISSGRKSCSVRAAKAVAVNALVEGGRSSLVLQCPSST